MFWGAVHDPCFGLSPERDVPCSMAHDLIDIWACMGMLHGLEELLTAVIAMARPLLPVP